MDKNIISIEEATSEEKKRKELEFDSRLTKQEKLSWQIVFGVTVAFVFTIGLVGVEIMLFHISANKDFLDLQNQYFQEIKDLREKQFNMELNTQKEIDSIKNFIIQQKINP